MHKQRFRSPDSRTDGATNNWLTTFNDMMTLLLVFFVMLFSIGSLDEDSFKQFQKGLQGAMGIAETGGYASEGVISVQQSLVVEENSTDNIQVFERLAADHILEAEYSCGGIRIKLNNELLFQSGSAHLTEEGLRILGKISALINPMHRYIRVEGHTDDRPIATVRYPSNWELSTDRAVSVITYFIDQGDIAPALLSAAGYGSSKPRALNDSEAHRAANRRVEIILGRQDSLGPDA
ncbi:MAG: hypothetical protein VR64_16905 [Desulfatitalea sp. BRH_c12]|nr:MAG: hypothetical protein VR64_16905 [Desulfatitalea sp. BRH_c12]